MVLNSAKCLLFVRCIFHIFAHLFENKSNKITKQQKQQNNNKTLKNHGS